MTHVDEDYSNQAFWNEGKHTPIVDVQGSVADDNVLMIVGAFKSVNSCLYLGYVLP